MIPNPVEAQWDAGNRCQQASGFIRIATVLNGWTNLKNPKAAIKAFNLLRCNLPDAEMFMYGVDFEEGGMAAQWATSQGLHQNIHFRGSLPPHKLQKELKEMSLLLHPAREEACPMALLEAMAIGLPIVAGSDAGGVSWVLDEGLAGFLTDVRDARKIAQTLLACIEQKEDRVQKQHHAYNRVRRLFSPHVVAEQYETLYKQVLACS
jgi:glycosyltransferase involved in cell wall biosynthesis